MWMHSTRERHLELLVILDVTVSMRLRIIPWERAELCFTMMTDIRRKQKSSERREQTEASSSVDRWINTAGWIMVPPIFQVN